MKTLTTIITFFIIASTVVAQNNCSKYYPLNEGTKFQFTVYDKKDKPTGVIDYEVVKVQGSGNDKTGTINSTMTDGKGKKIGDLSFTVSCNGEMASIDFKSMINPQIFEQFGEMDYELSGTNMEWPNNLSVGQQLPDATMDMKLSMGGMNMNITTTITDRKVLGKEEITTPAGTFDCFILTATTNTKMGISQSSTSKSWVAEKIGPVKSETYNKKGNVESRSLLTKFEE